MKIGHPLFVEAPSQPCESSLRRLMSVCEHVIKHFCVLKTGDFQRRRRYTSNFLATCPQFHANTFGSLLKYLTCKQQL